MVQYLLRLRPICFKFWTFAIRSCSVRCHVARADSRVDLLLHKRVVTWVQRNIA